MRAELSARNQLPLPKRAPEALGVEPIPTYLQVEVEEGRIVLTPACTTSANAARRKLAAPGLTEADVTDVVTWSRGRI
jgi:hypothetical protein